MKKLFVTLCLVLTTAASFAGIDPKFQEGYEYKSLDMNSAQKEHCMSLFGDSSVVFLRDSKVYIANFDTSATDLTNVKEFESLTKLGIKGTIAYDKKSNAIYYSVVEDDDNEWLYKSVFDEANDSWSKPERLRIEGLEKGRSGGTFLSNAGWNYVVVPKVIMQNPTMKGDRIYFTSPSIDEGRGGNDIYYIAPKDEKMWAYPVNAGDSVNTENNEDFAFFDTDGKMYFASDRDSISVSIYVFDDSLSVRMEDPYNTSTDDYNLIIKDETPYTVSTRTGNTNIFAWVKLPPPPPEPEPEPELEPIEIKFPWTFVLFDFDKFNVTDRYMREIVAMAKVMKEETLDGFHYVVEGHTDQRGSDEYNQRLSERRANAVREHLIEQGVDPSLLEAIGYGESRPLYPNPANEEEFYQNRRVVVNMVAPDGRFVTTEDVVVIVHPVTGEKQITIGGEPINK